MNIVNLKSGVTLELHRMDTVGSTSDEAKRISQSKCFSRYPSKIGEECICGAVVTALEQTAGVGRLGRIWESERASGVYMSVAVDPVMPIDRVQNITRIAAVAVFRTLESIFSNAGLELSSIPDTGIKWPNDIVINGKKVCGILTQASIMANSPPKVIIGIGINMFSREFSAELSKKATSVAIEFYKNGNTSLTQVSSEMYRSRIISEVEISLLENFFDVFFGLDDGAIGADIEREYTELCLNIGREVSVLDAHQNEIMRGRAVGIDESGGLLVRGYDSSIRSISSGEVSIRGIYGYL